jgi:hypothetical protein
MTEDHAGTFASGLQRLTRRRLLGHDVRLNLIGRDPHGIKIENFTSPTTRSIGSTSCCPGGMLRLAE